METEGRRGAGTPRRLSTPITSSSRQRCMKALFGRPGDGPGARRMARHGVVVEQHLGVAGDQPAVGGLDHRIDLDQLGVLRRPGSRPPRRPALELARDLSPRGRARRRAAAPGSRPRPISGSTSTRTIRSCAHLLDVDAALGARDHRDLAAVAVDQRREVVLARDAEPLLDVHRMHGLVAELPPCSAPAWLSSAAIGGHADAAALAAPPARTWALTTQPLVPRERRPDRPAGSGTPCFASSALPSYSSSFIGRSSPLERTAARFSAKRARAFLEVLGQVQLQRRGLQVGLALGLVHVPARACAPSRER
jgi:hypothetical protein